MNALTAKTGWIWVLTGWAFFRKRPFFLTNLFFTYLLSMVFLSMIPFVGQILPILIAPVFTFLFMQACSIIDSEEVLTFRGLFGVLNRIIMLRFLMVGGCYLLFIVFATGVSFLIEGGNVFLFFTQRSPDSLSSSQLSHLFVALGVIFIAYIPFAMAMWFVVPLIGWKNMGLGKALFYSFFTVVKAYKPFLVYIACWLLLGLVLPFLLAGLLSVLIGQTITTFVIFMLSVVLSVWMYCSFYPTYRDIFGRPFSNLSVFGA